ncbi:MAG: hypothetical protein PPP56_11105 [Longimonas sp.]|uniref:hypothetical protein n=1 Tax=Longimonas sp. TaxID=2039626 RepID=UPI00335480B8
MMRLQINIIMLVAAVLLVLSGCRSVDHVPYHSTASIPYETTSSITQMELIIGDEDMASDRDYVVFAAVDNMEVGYVLVAPHMGPASASYSLGHAVIPRAVPIADRNVDALVDAAQRANDHWSDADQEGKGTFVEFMHAPQQDILRISEDVEEWRPALRFTFSATPDGPSARILLGDTSTSDLQSVVRFTDREQIEDFRDVLVRAQDRATEMSR